MRITIKHKRQTPERIQYVAEVTLCDQLIAVLDAETRPDGTLHLANVPCSPTLQITLKRKS